MSEHARPTGSAEALAEIMAWHGMARYADPDDLAAYVRGPAAPSDDAPSDGAHSDEGPGSTRTARSPQ